MKTKQITSYILFMSTIIMDHHHYVRLLLCLGYLFVLGQTIFNMVSIFVMFQVSKFTVIIHTILELLYFLHVVLLLLSLISQLEYNIISFMSYILCLLSMQSSTIIQ